MLFVFSPPDNQYLKLGCSNPTRITATVLIFGMKTMLLLRLKLLNVIDLISISLYIYNTNMLQQTDNKPKSTIP